MKARVVRFAFALAVSISGLFAAPAAMACTWCSHSFAMDLLGERGQTLAGQELLRAMRAQAAVGLGLGTPNETVEKVLAGARNSGPAGSGGNDRRPDFRHVGLDGDWVRADQFDGRPLLVYFWSTWCASCRSSIGEFQRFSEAHADRLEVVGLAVDEIEAVRAFAADQGLGFRIAVGTTDVMATLRTWGASPTAGIPLTVLVDRQGLIRWRHSGTLTPADRAELDAELETVLAEAL